MKHARWIVVPLLLGLAYTLDACLWQTCEQRCYGQKTNEPRDFDDCIQRCKK